MDHPDPDPTITIVMDPDRPFLSSSVVDPDPDLESSLFVSTDPDPGPSINMRKKVIKTLILLFCDFILTFYLLKTDVSVPLTSNKQKKLIKHLFFMASCQPLTKKQDPDPYVSSTDPHPQIRICTVSKCHGFLHP